MDQMDQIQELEKVIANQNHLLHVKEKRIKEFLEKLKKK